jgi:RNA polymerase-binding transcription factor
MPAKKAARSKKTIAKAAARKAPAPRKAAKPALRKPKAAAIRVRPAKQKIRATGKTAAPARPAPRTGKPVIQALAARDPVIVKPKAAAVASPYAEARPALLALQARAARRQMMNDDDDDSATNHNLLLGPRNVRPYRERKGELYMGRDQLDHFRGILSSWKRDLMEEVDRTMTHMKDEAANPPDPNDRATLESEFALELRTRDRERKLIRKIEEALSRIEDGSYGYCVETGEPIGVKRLEARPVATLCIEAQERRERREKQYGDRDDWYR